MTKLYFDVVIFAASSNELLGQLAFLKATQRVMTESFLKPNAKTAFFKAILKSVN